MARPWSYLYFRKQNAAKKSFWLGSLACLRFMAAAPIRTSVIAYLGTKIQQSAVFLLWQNRKKLPKFYETKITCDTACIQLNFAICGYSTMIFFVSFLLQVKSYQSQKNLVVLFIRKRANCLPNQKN